MAVLRVPVLPLVVLGLLILLIDMCSSLEVGDSQCSDATAKTILATLGGKGRIMTVVMNFIKCLQKAAMDISKLIGETMSDLASCVTKIDPIEMVKCIAANANVKRIGDIVIRGMEVVKCALE